MKNDAQDFAQRLYARVPAHYRAYDAEQGFPLQALLTVVGEQAANLRQDLDDLWDNFFIETCQDWAVPYIGALIGANLLANPITRSNRLEVRDAVSWRRSKGTPAMLQALAGEVSGWAADFAEFYRSAGWSQNLNHIRLDRVLTAGLRDPYRLSLLGRAADPFAHAAAFQPAADLDEARIARGGAGLGAAAWGTPGRYQIRNLGFFVRRLQVFGVTGANPAGLAPPLFTFDPLGRDVPLFSEASRDAITRAAFRHSPSQYFGSGRDLAVRQNGIPLAASAPQPSFSSSRQPFAFGGGAISLDAVNGMRLLNARELQGRGAGFRISAQCGPGHPVLGTLNTTLASRGAPGAFQVHGGASAGGLQITIETLSAAARFPGAVLAVRAARNGALHIADALVVYLPAVFVQPGIPVTFLVADDGSTYFPSGFDPVSLARAAEGQTWPPAALSASAAPLAEPLVSRTAGALAIADPARLGNASLLIQAELFTGIFQPQGAIATVDQAATQYPRLRIPGPVWPKATSVPSQDAFSGNLPGTGTLAFLLLPLSPGFFPACEVIVRLRGGESLLVYLPEIQNVPAGGRRVFVAEDGSTWFAPDGIQAQPGLLDGFPLARASAGQVLPLSHAWPLQFRAPVALDLCAPERAALLAPGELGIDPERGRFAFAAGDPALPQTAALTVDYREAFTDRVGALTYDRLLDSARQPTRLVSKGGDSSLPVADNVASAPVYTTLAAAIAAAQDGDIIEIGDSRTYANLSDLLLANPAVKNLTIRAAAGQRPCVQFQNQRSLRVTGTMTSLELNGLLISGGPVRLQSKVANLLLAGCTLDPRDVNSLVASDTDLNSQAKFVLCRCLSGGLLTGPGVSQLIVADSIIGATTAAFGVQLERVTVLGGIQADVLSASESILDAIAVAEDQQSGCIRFSRYETGSVLPKRYHCVPSETQANACSGPGRCFAPIFNSRRFGSPLYAQLAANCPPELLLASEQASEIGAFAGAMNPIRLQNLRTKLQEFMPVGLTPVIVAES